MAEFAAAQLHHQLLDPWLKAGKLESLRPAVLLETGVLFLGPSMHTALVQLVTLAVRNLHELRLEQAHQNPIVLTGEPQDLRQFLADAFRNVGHASKVQHDEPQPRLAWQVWVVGHELNQCLLAMYRFDIFAVPIYTASDVLLQTSQTTHTNEFVGLDTLKYLFKQELMQSELLSHVLVLWSLLHHLQKLACLHAGCIALLGFMQDVLHRVIEPLANGHDVKVSNLRPCRVGFTQQILLFTPVHYARVRVEDISVQQIVQRCLVCVFVNQSGRHVD
mmetsp:Transcript_45030/g.119409  ORF Transcript_45030/g.119409 Transcript_45030/m.119409 type:complete len:276 (-) Transcript_45030:788-1615(-)